MGTGIAHSGVLTTISSSVSAVGSVTMSHEYHAAPVTSPARMSSVSTVRR